MGSSSPQNAATSTLKTCAPQRDHRSRLQPIPDRVSLWTGVNNPGYKRRQGLGIGVGRGLGVGWDRGVGVGLIVAVGVALGVLVAVAVGVAVTVGVAVAVGVGVAPPVGDTRTK